MANELVALLLQATLLGSAAICLVLGLRRPLRPTLLHFKIVAMRRLGKGWPPLNFAIPHIGGRYQWRSQVVPSNRSAGWSAS